MRCRRRDKMVAVRVMTVGHSNHAVERFLELLRTHLVEVVADVRSYPYSKYATQFDTDALRKSLVPAGFAYVYLGVELGGRPRGDEFYDEAGHARYDLVARSPVFMEGLKRLEQGMAKYRVALMCAEEDPAGCHRRLLIARVLRERGVEVDHIRGDGSVQSDDALAASEQSDQLSLFEEEPEWKSIPSVSPKKRQNSSSVF